MQEKPTDNKLTGDTHTGYEKHPFVVLQPGEKILCKIKRHPIGILTTYLAVGVAIIIIILLVAITGPGIVDQISATAGGASMTSDEMMRIAYIGTAILCGFITLLLLVATIVYWQNEWVVTDDSVTQINQTSLFTREVSQVPIVSLEDVTVDQTGIIQTIFGFGTLKLESAGERSKFQFQYCPHPNNYARIILEAHEEFIRKHGHQEHIT